MSRSPGAAGAGPGGRARPTAAGGPAGSGRVARVGVAVAVAAVDAGLAAAPGRWPRLARRVTKPAVVPAVAAAAGTRPSGPLAVALAGSWAGDVALLSRSDAGLLGGIGGFAVAHAAYLTALRRRHPARARDVLLPAAALVAAAGPLLWGRLDDPRLRAPVLGYAGLVTAMGAAAVRSGDRRLAAGGALFVVSDALVAVSKFGGRRRPAVDAAVMATYAAAQGLLAAALADD